jgi:ferredoxin
VARCASGRILVLAWSGEVQRVFEEVVVRVEVDRDRCEGNAVCLGIAPDLFDLDDEDYAVVKADPVPSDQEELADQAIAECPRAALIRKD